MDLQEKSLHFCGHIQMLTGVHCTLLDIMTAEFYTQPFRCQCELKNGVCLANQTHLYGCYEAERWGGKYIYYCPRGLVFGAIVLRAPGQTTEYGMITGPFIMSNSHEDVFEDNILTDDPTFDVPRLTTAQVRALNEVTHAVCGYLTDVPYAPDVDSGRQAGVLRMMYDLSEQSAQPSYPVESERQLQRHIRAGDKEGSQKLLNDLLCQLYFVSKTSLDSLKSHVRELLTLMSRAAIDGGADVNEVFGLCYHCEREIEGLRDFDSLNFWLSAVLHKFISFVFDFTDIKHHNVIRKTTSFIKEHLAEKLTLEQAAEQVYLSKSYFCRILKEELGYTFTEYVNLLRVERSKAYLCEGALSIAEIAYALGFDDQSYFTRIFKRHVGVSPGKYRTQKTPVPRDLPAGASTAIS